MDPALLDTDTVSEMLRGKNRSIAQRAADYRRQFGCYTVSAITVLEIIKGFAQAEREDRILDFCRRLSAEEVLPFDRDAAVIAGRIYGELERTGQTIGRADPMIAGVALRHALTLVTGNTEHYQRIAVLGFPLKMSNWRL